MRWSDPLSVNYPGVASHEYSKSHKSVLYEPVSMTGDNESAESKLDDVREEQHSRILENEELVRKVQLEVSALHPETHHSTHSSHHHSQPLGSNKTDDIEDYLKDKEIIMPLYEPFKGYKVAMVLLDGVPIEIIETTLSEEEIWHDDHSGSVLYPDKE